MTIELIKGDITKCEVDAIVNAANSGLLGGGGVDGAIHRAGGPAIMEACRLIRRKQGACPTGESVITTAGLLPARKVIHTVGPVWKGGNNNEEALLNAAYVNTLKLSEVNGITSLAFPNISAGVYGFPKFKAAKIAVNAIKSYRSKIIKRLVFVCYDHENYRIYQDLL